MTITGTIESRIYNKQNNAWYANNEAFVTIYNFFNGLSAQGVTRIAYNKGSSGSGMSYWDSGTYPGNGAWALFKFANATIPFYVLLQGSNLTTSSGFTYSSYAGCTPCVTSHTYGYFQNGYYTNCSIAVAMRLDGTSPWNGTTANAGADTKRTPVWTPGSSTLIVYPRCNSVGGSNVKNREVGVILSSANYNTFDTYSTFDPVGVGGRMHMLADENNILLLFDAGADASYGVFYFGKYVPRPGINPQVPYVMLNNIVPTNPQFNTVNYGAVSYSTPEYSNTCDGGICHPVAATGVKVCYVDYPTIMQDLKFHPTRTTPFRGRFDTFPLVQQALC
jgi:hypothetical protein